jgi:hypothetical protein
VADLGGQSFEALAELVDLDSEAGQGEGLLALSAVLGHDGVELRTPVEGGPTTPARAATASKVSFSPALTRSMQACSTRATCSSLIRRRPWP